MFTDLLSFQIGLRLRQVFISDKSPIQILFSKVSNAEMTEAKPANLGCFGVADNLAKRFGIPNVSVNGCSVSITEQFHRAIFQVAENGGAISIWFVTITADLRSSWYSKESDSSVISVTYDSKIRQVIVFRMVFDSDRFSLQMESSSVSNAEMTEVKPANLGCFGVADNLA